MIIAFSLIMSFIFSGIFYNDMTGCDLICIMGGDRFISILLLELFIEVVVLLHVFEKITGGKNDPK